MRRYAGSSPALCIMAHPRDYAVDNYEALVLDEIPASELEAVILWYRDNGGWKLSRCRENKNETSRVVLRRFPNA
jgi:hypothetical protein